MILPARLDKCRRGRGSLTLALVGALRLENHFLKLARIEPKLFLEFTYNSILNYREQTRLKRAVGSVWRISHGALPGQAYAQQIGRK